MDKSIFLNIFDYKDPAYPFQIFIGGRGTGKTYSAYTGCLGLQDNKVHEKKFIWMRRTQKQLELMEDSEKGEGVSDIKKINEDFGTNYGYKALNDSLAGIYKREETEEGKFIYSGAPIGYGVALSTISSIRGINFSDCDICIYDEFVPERHERKMKEEGRAFLNAYETFNRNREFNGEDPIYMFMLSNADDIYNPIFVSLGIVSICEKMKDRGKLHHYIPERGLAIHILPPSEAFLEKKKETALYKLTKGLDFYDAALENKFAYNDFSLIEHRNIQGYIPFAALDEAYLYRKKGESIIYVTYAKAKVPIFKSKNIQDVQSFKRQFGNMLYGFFTSSRISFESYELKEKILDIIM